MEKQKTIELRSEKVRNVIGKIPPALVRGGITWVSLLLFIGLFAAWRIPYVENVRIEDVKLSIDDGEEWRATGLIPYTYVAQIDTGMEVELELEGYNARTFGYLHGKVQSVDRRVTDKGADRYFQAIVRLDKPSANIPLFPGMRGEAYIFVRRTNLLRQLLPQTIR
jgi:hypothetical protein